MTPGSSAAADTKPPDPGAWREQMYSAFLEKRGQVIKRPERLAER